MMACHSSLSQLVIAPEPDYPSLNMSCLPKFVGPVDFLIQLRSYRAPLRPRNRYKGFPIRVDVDDDAYIIRFQLFPFIADYIGCEHDLLMFFEHISPPARVRRNKPGIVWAHSPHFKPHMTYYRKRYGLSRLFFIFPTIRPDRLGSLF